MHKRVAGAVRVASGLAITLFAAAASRAAQPSTDRSPQDQPDDSNFGLNPSLVPSRPAPLIEIGDKFFGAGPLQRGIQLPTGAVWMPNFTVFGTYHTAIQAFNTPPAEPAPSADRPRSEWANRLDILGNLQLSGTERILIGFRPFDDATFARPALAKYTGYQFTPDETDGWNYKFVAQPTTFFFEGDLGQIFPALDPNGTKPWDIGFSVGRQPLLYQDGLLLDDDIDAIGVTRNTILPRGGSNAQITAIYGWDQINRGDGINHGDRLLLGLLINADFRPSTWDFDLFYVDGHGQSPDGVYAGLSAVQRFGLVNTTFRVLGSKAIGHDSGGPNSRFSEFGNGSSAVGNGVLLFSEMSYTPMSSNNLIYLDTYWGIDRFTSAARGPDRGGPLGRVGILFAEQPIGRYGSALSSDPERSVGFALGYQKFLDPDRRQQLVLELGAREGTAPHSPGAAAVGARYQHAFGQHTVLQFDSFVALNEGEGLGYGGRVEFRFEF
ncbi:MAG TPA: hypothetical protein VG326_06730 [Tepidisphaeraceae bacterium]|jgi:hypothetical protein|nr:hypothetical protein [Tepidisphaeraceae bacterium]